MLFKEYYNKQSSDANYVYHGTDEASAQDIEKNGINMSKSAKGYFGRGFYTTPNESLAMSNYAEFSGDEDGGVVLKFEIVDRSGLLDLRDENNFIKWRDSKLPKLVSRDDFDKIAREAGVDGLYDNSFEGWVFYNPSVLKLVGRV